MRKKSAAFVRFLVDAYMYTTLPACATIVFTALSFCAVFVIAHYLGWLLGSGLCVPLYFLWHASSQTTIVSAQSRLSCGGAWGVIVTIVSGFYLFLANDLGGVWSWLIAANAALICGSLYATTTTVPTNISHRGSDPVARCAVVALKYLLRRH